MASTGPEKKQKRETRNGDRNENERRHQVSGGSRLLGHRDVPHRLVYGRAGDRTQPDVTSGEQHLHPCRLRPCGSHHHHQASAPARLFI